MRERPHRALGRPPRHATGFLPPAGLWSPGGWVVRASARPQVQRNRGHALDNLEVTVTLPGQADSRGRPHYRAPGPSPTSRWQSALQRLALPVHVAGPRAPRGSVERTPVSPDETGAGVREPRGADAGPVWVGLVRSDASPVWVGLVRSVGVHTGPRAERIRSPCRPAGSQVCSAWEIRVEPTAGSAGSTTRRPPAVPSPPALGDPSLRVTPIPACVCLSASPENTFAFWASQLLGQRRDWDVSCLPENPQPGEGTAV